MRILLAKILVGVTGLLIVALAILFAVIRNASEAPAPRRPVAKTPQALGSVLEVMPCTP